jgi:hypothetical protein
MLSQHLDDNDKMVVFVFLIRADEDDATGENVRLPTVV